MEDDVIGDVNGDARANVDTNVDAGRKLLRESGLQLEEASDLTDAAKKVVAARNRAS